MNMKVLHVIPFLSGSCGGPVQAVTQLCQELNNQGVETAIATTTIDHDKTCVIPDSVPVYSFPREFDSFLPAQFAFSRQMNLWFKSHLKDFQLLHVHYLFSYPSTIACRYADKYKIPYILTPEGMLSRECLKRSALKKKFYISFIEKNNLVNASAIHFICEEEMRNARIRDLKLENRYIVQPYGLNFDKFGSLKDFKGVFRKKYNLTEDKKIILFLSRLDPIKGLDLLIPGLKILSEKRNDFIFVLAGAGNKNYEKAIHAMLHKSGLREVTILTGFIGGNEKLSAFADADIFILPSYHENFGMVAVEAMAAGLPIVISNKVGIHELVERSRAGIITELSGEKIVSALNTLLSDDGLRVKMGRWASCLARDNFDIKKIARKTQEIYLRLISDKLN